MMSTTADDRFLWPVAAAVFLSAGTATVFLCLTMPGGMAMPGGWTMSMAWMRMPGQTWPVAAAWFLAMWLVMMVAMMTPALAASLSVYRGAADGLRRAAIAAGGYFFVWTMFGAAVYPLGIAVTQAEMRSASLARAVPAVSAAVLIVAGLLQLTAWKARQLEACRDSGCSATPWPHGVRLGLRCALCCAGFMAVLLVVGVMDLGAMAAVTAGITVERFAPRPGVAARAIGTIAIAAGAFIGGRVLLATP